MFFVRHDLRPPPSLLLPDPEPPVQLALVPAPVKSEAKQRLLSLQHNQVEAYCLANRLEVPTPVEWANALEVATYVVSQWADDTGRLRSAVTVKKVAKGAWFGREQSKSTAERALRLLRRLGVLSSPRGSWHTLDFAQVEVVRRAAEQSVTEPSPNRQLSVTEPSKRRTSDGSVTVSRRFGDGSDYLTPCPLPTPPPPGATGDGPDDWSEVVEEVLSCGVNQGKMGVDAARTRGATPDEVRAVVTEWRKRREGWQQCHVVLYRRLVAFAPGQTASEDWPPFDEAYQAKLDRERRAGERETAIRRLSREHHEFQRREAQSREEWDLVAFRRLLAEHCPELAARAERERPLRGAQQPRPPPTPE